MLLANHGTYWSAGKMRQLIHSLDQGEDLRSVAHRHKRSVTACASAYRGIRKVRLLDQGDDSDTLVSIKKRARSCIR